MSFLLKNSDTKMSALRYRFLDLALVFAGGGCFAAALPPFNLWPLAFFALAPLIVVAARSRWLFGALAGYVWGIGWSVFAFQFLREIDPAVPYLMPWVISLWPALFGALLPFLFRNTVFPLKTELGGYEERKLFLESPASFRRLFFFSLGAAALYTLVEWTRSRLFPWNDLSITMWRNLPLIQFVRFTGHFGIMFTVAFVSALIAAARLNGFKWSGKKLLLTGAALIALLEIGGSLLFLHREVKQEPNFFPVLLQGDISQRRDATLEEADEALDIYAGLTREAAQMKPTPELIVWPESAIPVPFRSRHPISTKFRGIVQSFSMSYHIPMLLGALDFADPLPKDPAQLRITNSALHFDAAGKLVHKYDKIHRVPFGEYVPFRRFLPDFVVQKIDMNRDLASGTNYNPLELKENVRAGVAICYEGIFSYLTRSFAQRGANVLLVISNDAWYPVSSEPEQHLANAVMRAVETGLPMVRCGNNGGSLVVTPRGEVTQVLEVPGPEKRLELRRGRGIARMEVYVDPAPGQTFFVRFGEWFVLLLFLGCASWAGFGVASFFRRKKYFEKVLEVKNE